MANLNFDASQVAPATAPEAIPAGWYTGHMTASEMKPTSDGTGAYLEAEFTILAPQEYANRKVFDRINLQNKNPVAVEIGYKTLSAICHAVGIIQVQDSTQLHNRPLQIKVGLRPAGPGADGKHYDASNEVKGYKGVESAGGAPAASAAPVPPAAPAAHAPAAWTPPAPPTAPAAPVGPQRPTDPSHIHAAGTPQEQWWINGAWTPAPVQAPSAPPAPPAPPAAPAPAAAPAAPAAPQGGAPTPPWAGGAPAAPATPAAPAAGGAPVPPWAQK